MSRYRLETAAAPLDRRFLQRGKRGDWCPNPHRGQRRSATPSPAVGGAGTLVVLARRSTPRRARPDHTAPDRAGDAERGVVMEVGSDSGAGGGQALDGDTVRGWDRIAG